LPAPPPFPEKSYVDATAVGGMSIKVDEGKR
jgi:hypothetical protein